MEEKAKAIAHTTVTSV